MRTAEMAAVGGYGPWAPRYREVVDWPVNRKVALVTGVLLPYTALGFITFGLLLPAETLSDDVTSYRGAVIVWTVSLLVCLLLAYASTRRGRDGSWTVYPLILSVSTCLAFLCWLFGSFSTLLMMMIPAMVLAMSLLFDPRIGWVAFGLAILDWGGLATLEIQGVLPYAPALRDRSIDALVTPSWFFFFATVMGAMVWVLAL